ncbi:MAG: glutamate racemase [Nitrospirae bacterium]|jgi:glutamate racemase|nr:glutamate racemase [Nitrospirota bacterium]
MWKPNKPCQLNREFDVDNREKPIGVFDSGIGGLTVLKEIINELPYENTVYLGDTARVPYGIRSPETVIRYSFENTTFLYSKDIKLLVVACNTASSVSLDFIRKNISVPVIGVIEPGVKAAVRKTKNNKIGVIGTEATVKSNSYTNAIKNMDASIEVYSLSCPLFVPLVEEGWTEGEIVTSVAKKYLGGLKDMGIDTLILGCTHYPLLKTVLTEVIGGDVRLIDSAIETSRKVKMLLENLGLNRENNFVPRREFFVTDSPERFLKVGENFLGEKIEHIEKIAVSS